MSISQIARDLSFNTTMLGRWCREAEQGKSTSFTGSGTPRDKELADLRRELARVKKERYFLKDAAGFFAKEWS